jgi:L-lysine 2,3-aminomutase
MRCVNLYVEVLAELSERLFDVGVLPYYLHQLDRVAGASHFEVDEGSARELHRQLRLRLPGYLLPRLVREVAGAGSKTAL